MKQSFNAPTQTDPPESAKLPIVVVNRTESIFFITTKWRAGENGSAAIRETEYSIGPGEAIDLSVLGFELVTRRDLK